MKYDKVWYESLIKPKFQPPAWVFGPVWTVLYVLMFVSLAFIIKAKFNWQSIIAYLLFILQLVVNLSWTPVFFKEHNLRKAFLLCALLTLLVFLTVLIFFHISKIAGLLMVPYLLWSLFASLLSFEILELNEW